MKTKHFKLLIGCDIEPVHDGVIRERYSFDFPIRTEWMMNMDRLDIETLQLSLNRYTGQKQAYIEYILSLRQTERL